MNNFTILFNFQTQRILNETLYDNVKLLSTADESGKSFQEALSEFQEEVIRTVVIWGVGHSASVLT